MTNIIVINVVWASVLIGVAIPVMLVIWCLVKKQRQQSQVLERERLGRRDVKGLCLYSFAVLNEATDAFSKENMVWKGGFGFVYKGVLKDGKEMAVKRLSTQGIDQFEVEVNILSNLDHPNIVKLYGYSTVEDERFLVYEFVKNRSLDNFIFGENAALVWSQRLQIMQGICQGLSYLQEHRVVHLDIKPHNILLDSDMNPKIADFGMAMVLGTRATRPLAGTQQYMSQEHMLGLFSMKSDVYSFGVLVLEMLSGRENIRFDHLDRTQNLVGHAWDAWVDNAMLRLKDPKLGDMCTEGQFMKIFILALHCVQEREQDRPLASQLLEMLAFDGEVARPVLPSYIRPSGLASTMEEIEIV